MSIQFLYNTHGTQNRSITSHNLNRHKSFDCKRLDSLQPLRRGIIWFLYKKAIVSPLQIVHGALDSFASPVEDVGVNHGSFHVLVPQAFLHGPR